MRSRGLEGPVRRCNSRVGMSQSLGRTSRLKSWLFGAFLACLPVDSASAWPYRARAPLIPPRFPPVCRVSPAWGPIETVRLARLAAPACHAMPLIFARRPPCRATCCRRVGALLPLDAGRRSRLRAGSQERPGADVRGDRDAGAGARHRSGHLRDPRLVGSRQLLRRVVGTQPVSHGRRATGGPLQAAVRRAPGGPGHRGLRPGAGLRAAVQGRDLRRRADPLRLRRPVHGAAASAGRPGVGRLRGA